MLKLNSLLLIDFIKGLFPKVWLEKAGVALNRVILSRSSYMRTQTSRLIASRISDLIRLIRSLSKKKVPGSGFSPAEGSIDRETLKEDTHTTKGR